MQYGMGLGLVAPFVAGSCGGGDYDPEIRMSSWVVFYAAKEGGR